MTRNEFLSDVEDWGDLLRFCSDAGCDLCEDIYDWDGMEQEVRSIISDYCYDGCTLSTIADLLDSIPSGYDFYVKGEYDEWFGLDDDDDDFTNRKDNVYLWADDTNAWDEEAEEEAEEESIYWTYEEDGGDNENEEDEGLFIPRDEDSICQLFADSVDTLKAIRAEECCAQKRAVNDSFDVFMEEYDESNEKSNI